MPRLPHPRITSASKRFFFWAGTVSVLAWIGLRILAPGAALPWTPAMLEAAGTMDSVLAAVERHCLENGIPIDSFVDPHETCLLGPEVSQLFTSLGQLEAKRTTLSADFAGLLVHLLEGAGVEAGDRVAVGASGSFPALLVASLSAVRALDAEAVVILSLGASSYGATRPEFHLLDLHEVLQELGVAEEPPAAVTLGGSGDVGGGFDPGFREELLGELEGRSGRTLVEPELASNVTDRLAIYGETPDVFINVGGAEANMGTNPAILDVPPGLLPPAEGGRGDLPPRGQRGVLLEMASRGTPVIHLLNIRGLALRYRLSWDPPVLPKPGSTRLEDSQQGKTLRFWLLTSGYLLALMAVGYVSRNSAAGG